MSQSTLTAPSERKTRCLGIVKCVESHLHKRNHKIFTQGILLQICSFDQWGVELGKGLANNIQEELANESISDNHDSSTKGLMHFYQESKLS